MLGVLGIVGWFVWPFSFEVDYALWESLYPRWVEAWFAFWLTVVLPFLGVYVRPQRPALAFAAVLAVAFAGVAGLQATARVIPSWAKGILPTAAAVHAITPSTPLAGRPFAWVLAGFGGPYLAQVPLALAAYVLGVRAGRRHDRTPLVGLA